MKIERILPILLLLALLLSACGARGQSAPVPAEAADPAAAAELTALLDSLRDRVQPGTAGASLKAAAAAADLLDWAAGTPLDDGALAAAAADWLSAQSEETRGRLPEQLDALRGMLRELSERPDAAAGLLSDAGLEGRGPWDAASAERALRLLDALGAD